MSVTDDDEFQFHTVHSLLNTSKTLSELSDAGIKVKCLIYLGVSSIHIVGDIETRNNVTEVGSVKGKKEGTQDRTLGDTIAE